MRKKHEVLIPGIPGMNLENRIPDESHQTQKVTGCVSSITEQESPHRYKIGVVKCPKISYGDGCTTMCIYLEPVVVHCIP